MKFDARRAMLILAVVIVLVVSMGSFSAVDLSNPIKSYQTLAGPMKFLVSLIITATLYMGWLSFFYGKK